MSDPIEHQNSAFKLGYEISGPMLIPYCKWIQSMAKRLKIDNLVFLARDGQLPHKIYDLMQKDQHCTTKAHYCYTGSRASWYPCLPHMIGESIIHSRIQNDYHTLSNTLSKFELPNEASFFFGDANSPSEIADTFVSPNFRKYSEKQSEPQRERFIKYMSSFGFTEKSRIAIVDLGWHGRFQTALEQIFSTKFSCKIFGFYYGLNTNIDPKHRFSYAFGPKLIPHKLSFYPCILEMLSPADHPSVNGLSSNSMPVFGKKAVAPIDMIHAIHKGALTCLEKEPTRQINLNTFINNPPEYAIDLFKSISFQAPFSSDTDEPIIKNLSTRDIWKVALYPGRRLNEWRWPQAELKNSAFSPLDRLQTIKFQTSSLLSTFTNTAKDITLFTHHLARILLCHIRQLKNEECASFDVFDTVLYRKSGTPDSIFKLLEKRLAIEGLSMMRTEAELFLVKRRDYSEITHDDIYDYLKHQNPHIDWEIVKETELHIESKNLAATQRGRRLINRHRTLGHKIVFISDMYLPEEFIHNILKREGLLKTGDLLFVSSSHNCTKAMGQLFELVRSKLNQASWKHYGDHPRNDILMSLKAGLQPRWLPHSYTRSTKKWLRTKLRL